jgi:hypothetical protein
MDAMFDNTRIYELIQQSEVSISHPRCFSGYIDINKFAKLIVEECADIAKHHVMNISTYDHADFVDEQIKQHFGVEE